MAQKAKQKKEMTLTGKPKKNSANMGRGSLRKEGKEWLWFVNALVISLALA